MKEESRKKGWKKLLSSFIGICLILFLLYYLVRFNPLFSSIVSYDALVSGAAQFLPKLFVIVTLFFIFKLFHVFAIGFVFSRFAQRFVSKMRMNSIERLVTFFWWFLFAAIVLSILINNVGTIIASLGLIGLGLTFALQKPILNFVGWITIIFKDIYNEGDRIKIGTVRGDVKEIHLMNTVLYGLLETADSRSQKVITVPNELVLTTDVENYTKDSNYILEEMAVSITYESDYHKAMKLLNSIITKHLQRNLKSYIKWRQSEKARLDNFIAQLVSKKNTKRADVEHVEKEKEEVHKEIQHMEELKAEFKPKIRVEMADSSIILLAQFLTPYDEIKKNRTEINLAFLDAILKDPSIEIAYPHLELVKNGKTKTWRTEEQDNKKDESSSE